MSQHNGIIPFLLYTRPTTDAEGKPFLYARPDPSLKLQLRDVDEFSRNEGGLRFHELNRVFETFMEVFSSYIARGYRIETPIGSFYPKLTINADISNPSLVFDANVDFAGIGFTPSKQFNKEVFNHHKGCHKISQTAGNSQIHNLQFMEKALNQSLSDGYITIRSFMAHSGLSYYSAKKYLDELCQGNTPLLACSKAGNTLLYSFRKSPTRLENF